MPVLVNASAVRSRPRKNIFLDFMSPENHIIYGADRNLGPDEQRAIISISLNVAVLLCGDYCLLPPFFPLQSSVVREVLQVKQGFIAMGVIRIPLRESSLSNFFEKKMVEYEPVKGLYPGLYDQSGRSYVQKVASSIIKRHAAIGNQIASRWEAGPDESAAWKPLIHALAAPEIQAVRSIPHVLKESGESVTWSGIKRLLPVGVHRAAFEVNQALQHEYARIYLDEYDATIVSGAPPKTTDFLLNPPDLSYDYWAFTRVLAVLGVGEMVKKMADEEILSLKYNYGFLEFMSVLDEVCQQASGRQDVLHCFAGVSREVRSLKPYKEVESAQHAGGSLRSSSEKVEALGDYLLEVASAFRARGVAARSSPETAVVLPSTSWRPQMRKVFVVHGRNHSVRDQIRLFLHEIDLSPVVLDREVPAGRTLVEKFEELADQCDYAIVIATPDDHLTDRTDGREVKRLRQNVVLEIGFFWGKYGRKRKFSILLEEEPELELPSDIDGIGYIPITDDLGETKRLLLKELGEAGVLRAG